ncbi:hypothetical protein J4Q44_G00267900 [Coregonus suidteri]|uniref:Uncharacterized protein n=1 Tax=Coregonus suidteri TaxID=861788 RepID=A0AAN8QF96_9TELE
MTTAPDHPKTQLVIKLFCSIFMTIKNHKVNSFELSFAFIKDKAVFKFGQSSGQPEITQNLTVDNQRGSEDEDQRAEVKLSTRRKNCL